MPGPQTSAPYCSRSYPWPMASLHHAAPNAAPMLPLPHPRSAPCFRVATTGTATISCPLPQTPPSSACAGGCGCGWVGDGDEEVVIGGSKLCIGTCWCTCGGGPYLVPSSADTPVIGLRSGGIDHCRISFGKGRGKCLVVLHRHVPAIQMHTCRCRSLLQCLTVVARHASCIELTCTAYSVSQQRYRCTRVQVAGGAWRRRHAHVRGDRHAAAAAAQGGGPGPLRAARAALPRVQAGGKGWVAHKMPHTVHDVHR